MKFNWGTGIALVYATFAVSMLVFVFAAQRHDPGLISKNYYELDLNYQQRMVEKQNTATLHAKLTARVDAANRQLWLQFPIEEAGVPSEGKIKMYRSAGTSAGDVSAEIRTDSAGLMALPIEKLAGGRWRIDVNWQAGGQSFYQELVVAF